MSFATDSAATLEGAQRDPAALAPPAARPVFVVRPAGAAQRARYRHDLRPWRTRIEAPEPDPDEDASLPGLLDAARYYFDQLLALFGAPDEIAAQTVVAGKREGLLRCWAPNLAGIVRQLLLCAALALMAGLVSQPLPARRSAPVETRAPLNPACTRRRTLDVGSLVSEARADAAPQPPDRPSCLRRPDPVLFADLVARIGATLADFDACARRLARRFARAEREAGVALVFIQPDPPPSVLPGGRYNPLSRKGQMAWAHASADIDRLRPFDPGDG
jgi:hypothetical protein